MKAVIMAIQERDDIFYRIKFFNNNESTDDIYAAAAYKLGWKMEDPKRVDPLLFLSRYGVKRLVSVEGENNLEEKIDKALEFLQNT